ncbi:MAG TPA: NAD(+)/NADH kinase [Candidatus Bathyarchaeia archaeon]|nr:NAD(+)/NADH kinase [Candidatus Bathyarchaeia archaeon]
MKIESILVLYKRSTYQHYQEERVSPCPDPGEFARFKETHDRHYETLAKVENILNQHRLHYEKSERGKKLDYDRFKLIITVGGDGTFFEAARQVRNQFILGVNSDPQWSVGRFCTATQENFDSILSALLEDRPHITNRNRLKITSKHTKHTVHFINDILVCHANPASLSRYVLCIGNDAEEQRSSGVWISTAAGSTGALHSAGGQILAAESSDFQYMPRELYAGWSGGHYHLRGGVLPQDTPMHITSLMQDGVVFIDGSHECMPFPASEEIQVTSSEFPLKVLHL